MGKNVIALNIVGKETKKQLDKLDAVALRKKVTTALYEKNYVFASYVSRLLARKAR